MSVTRTYGRRISQDPALVSLALSIASDLASAAGKTLIALVARGASVDFQEWVTVRVRARGADAEERLSQEYAKRITRYGAVAVDTGSFFSAGEGTGASTEKDEPGLA